MLFNEQEPLDYGAAGRKVLPGWYQDNTKRFLAKMAGFKYNPLTGSVEENNFGKVLGDIIPQYDLATAQYMKHLAGDSPTGIGAQGAIDARKDRTKIPFEISAAAIPIIVGAYTGNPSEVLSGVNNLSKIQPVDKNIYNNDVPNTETENYAKAGAKIKGTKHTKGGIALIDSITGEKKGEVEGGERFFSVPDTDYMDELAEKGKHKKLGEFISRVIKKQDKKHNTNYMKDGAMYQPDYVEADAKNIKELDDFEKSQRLINSITNTPSTTTESITTPFISERLTQKDYPTSLTTGTTGGEHDSYLPYIADAARGVYGIATALRKTPKYTMPKEYVDALGRLKTMSYEGLSPEAKAIAQRRIDSTLASQTHNIINAAGGNAGAVLANTQGAYANADNAALRLAGMDNEARRSNFLNYLSGVNRDTTFRKGIFDQYTYNPAMQARAAGAALAQESIQDAIDQSQYNKTYGVNSPYSGYMDFLAKQGLTLDEYGNMIKNPSWLLDSN